MSNTKILARTRLSCGLLIGRIATVLGTVAILLASSNWLAADTPPRHAQVLHQAAEEALAAGQPARALQSINTALARDPADFAALFLLSLALRDVGEDVAAANAASRAYAAARTDAERLQAARLAGSARLALGRYARAQWWLRRAANHANTPEQVAAVRDEFRNIRQNNPLSASVNFSMAPSDNINNGAAQETFRLEGLDFDFQLPPGSLPLSGVEYAGDVLLSYRLSQSETQITSIETYLYGRTYSLSRAAQDSVPDLKGSDYSLALAEVSLHHRRLLLNGLGPTDISAHAGKVWFGGDPLWDYQKIALGQEFPAGENAAVAVLAAVQDQTALIDTQPDTMVYDLVGTYSTALANQDTLQISLAARLNDAETEEETFTDYRAFIDYGFAEPLLGAKWAVSFGVGQLSYDEFALSLDGRRDTYVTVGGTATFEQISYFGFSPSVSVSATRTDSDVTQFTTSQIQGRFGIQSNF